jgi:hypothetical protein
MCSKEKIMNSLIVGFTSVFVFMAVAAVFTLIRSLIKKEDKAEITMESTFALAYMLISGVLLWISFSMNVWPQVFETI